MRKEKNIEGKPWQIAIEKPTTTGERAVEAVIGLDNMGMASSGDYRIYFEEMVNALLMKLIRKQVIQFSII